jgi:hypothetical protein
MSAQEDISTLRSRGMSRREIAEASEFTQGIIWRIEMKGVIKDNERSILEPVLERLLRETESTSGADGHGRDSKLSATTATASNDMGTASPGSSADGVRGPASSESAGTASTSTTGLVGSGNTAPQTAPGVPSTTVSSVDWDGLSTVAGAVSDHDLERGLLTGPDRSLGYRLFSNSELRTFKDCRRKWWLGWYRQLKPKFESPTGALAIGNRIHRALQLFYVPQGLPRTDPRTALEMLIVQDWTALSNSLASEPERLATFEKKFNDEANLERAMISGYVEWITETGGDSEFDVIASEQYVEVDITADIGDTISALNSYQGFRLIGKLDVRVKRRRDGVRLFIDHKTLVEFTTVRQILPIDEQMIHYLLLEFLSTNEGEERCDGALYNMIRKVKRTGTAKPPFYDRVEVQHNQHVLDNYKRRVIATVADIIDIENSLDQGVEHFDVAYPNPTRDCRWKCAFFSVCSMFDDGSRVEDMLKQFFVKSDPLSYYNSPEMNEI